MASLKVKTRSRKHNNKRQEVSAAESTADSGNGIVTIEPEVASPTVLITVDPNATIEQSSLLTPTDVPTIRRSRSVAPSVLTVATPASSSSSPPKNTEATGPSIGLVVGLIVAFASIISFLLFLIYRLRSKRAAALAQRGEQLHSPKAGDYSGYDQSHKMEMEQTVKPRTRSLISAFPLPPDGASSIRSGSSIGGEDGLNAFRETVLAPVPSSTSLPIRSRKKSADRRSVISWFSIKSRRKSGYAAKKDAAAFEWYRSGVDDLHGDPSGRESAASIAPPPEMFERASPLSELSQKAMEKLWARKESSTSLAASSTDNLAPFAKEELHLSRDLRSDVGSSH